MEQQNLVFDQISSLVEFVTEPDKHSNEHMENENHLLWQLLGLWSPKSHWPAGKHGWKPQCSTFSHPQSECVSLGPSHSTHRQELSPRRAAAPRNPQTTGANPRNRGQGELPDHYTGRITALKVIFTLPRRISSGDSTWQLLKQTRCLAAKGFLETQSEEILVL